MKRYITRDDFEDTYVKIKQRGLRFFWSKFNFSGQERTISAFDKTYHQTANWWIIPKMQTRWNQLITGKTDQNYVQYFVENWIEKQKNIKILSVGSGVSSQEIFIAQQPNVSSIICIELNESRLEIARKNANELGLKNIQFICENFYQYQFNNQKFDYILFNSSLHHLNKIPDLFQQKLIPLLTKEGRVMINEFVGPDRMQFPKIQVQNINKALELIPKKYRTKLNTSIVKNKHSGPGLLRMILADPSECVDSSRILPTIYKYFDVEVEKPFGGSLLANVLKDIAHHFVDSDVEKTEILNQLFQFEDLYLNNHPSDFVFGVYKIKNKDVSSMDSTKGI